jgi:hypothetical protein
MAAVTAVDMAEVGAAMVVDVVAIRVPDNPEVVGPDRIIPEVMVARAPATTTALLSSSSHSRLSKMASGCDKHRFGQGNSASEAVAST